MSEGRNPDAIDKEYIRLWLGERGLKGEVDPLELTNEVRCEAARRYVRAFERVGGPSQARPLRACSAHSGRPGDLTPCTSAP